MVSVSTTSKSIRRYIRTVTIEDIARVARKYLDSENYTLVVVGPVAEDGKSINEQ